MHPSFQNTIKIILSNFFFVCISLSLKMFVTFILFFIKESVELTKDILLRGITIIEDIYLSQNPDLCKELAKFVFQKILWFLNTKKENF